MKYTTEWLHCHFTFVYRLPVEHTLNVWLQNKKRLAKFRPRRSSSLSSTDASQLTSLWIAMYCSSLLFLIAGTQSCLIMTEPSPTPPVVFQNSINITPELMLGTFQFENDPSNTVASSISVALILANFNFIIHNLVSLTHRNYFNYVSYLHSYIFSSSKEPFWSLSWIRGENSYFPAHWPQTKKNVVYERLFYPLLARTVIFILSITSIGLTIPLDREIYNRHFRWQRNCSARGRQGRGFDLFCTAKWWRQ